MRRVLGVALLITAFTTVIGAVGDSNGRQRAVAFLDQPTLIVSKVVQGSVRITHDPAKESKGEPCMRVEALDSRGNVTGLVIDFHCVRLEKPSLPGFAVTTVPTDRLGAKCALTVVQFAGDKVAHGVPQL